MATTKRKMGKRAPKRAPSIKQFKDDTPEKVLQALLKSKVDLSQTWLERIKAVLATKTVPNPLENPPKFCQFEGPLTVSLWKSAINNRSADAFYRRKGHEIVFRDHEYVDLGSIDAYDTRLCKDPLADTAVLIRGCVREYSEIKAREHWVDGWSEQSGDSRPNSTEMIDYCAAIAKHLGWKW